MSADPEPAGGNRRWLGAALALFVPVVVLQGLNRTQRFREGPLGEWYVQAGVTAVAVLGWLAVEWLVGRAYRRRE